MAVVLSIVESVVMGDVRVVTVVMMELLLGLRLELSVVDEIVLAEHRVVGMMEMHVLVLQILVILIGMSSGWLLVLGHKRIEIDEIVFGRVVFCCTARLCEVSELVIIMLHLDWSLLSYGNGLGRSHIEIEFEQTHLNLRLNSSRSYVFNDFDRLRLL